MHSIRGEGLLAPKEQTIEGSWKAGRASIASIPSANASTTGDPLSVAMHGWRRQGEQIKGHAWRNGLLLGHFLPS